MNKNTSTKQNSIATHHYIRTFFASVLGVLAVWLILISITVVWLNRTITDTQTYTQTVTPLASVSSVKNFISDKINTEIEKNATPAELAALLLPAESISSRTSEQLNVVVKNLVNTNIEKTLDSPAFTRLWVSTNRVAHQQIVKQIKSNTNGLTLDLTSSLNGAVNLLQQTPLAPIVDQIQIPDNAAVITINSPEIHRIHDAYTIFERATWAIVILTILLIVLACIISVHHKKTLRRIAVFSGLGLLVLALGLLLAPSLQLGGSNVTNQTLIADIIRVMVRKLLIIALISGLVLVILAISSKAYDLIKTKKHD